MPEKILVTGANGQIGRVLTHALREQHGQQNVIASDIVQVADDNEPYLFLDILNETRLYEIVEDYQITQVYHLAAILSASGEWNPLKTWNINLNGLLTILNLAKDGKINRVFFPSTIAVFGKTTPRVNTPQDVPLVPETIYGVSKVSGELLCHYYHQKYGVDVRSVRYPGIIGYQSVPHGGTTDYAVEIFHSVLTGEAYKCFLAPDTYLPMMYISDAIRATLELMSAPSESIKTRTSYNLSAMSFSPAEIYAEIKKIIPAAEIEYEPDFRQEIAASWTESIDDSAARTDWNWQPEYDLEKMVRDMIEKISDQMRG
ncbi:NAD-dependent epimerase [Lewinellaceae bacterium SD302]|nr:NAD-dependent epimerase [Lewinellaceae bacterium SD302]